MLKLPQTYVAVLLFHFERTPSQLESKVYLHRVPSIEIICVGQEIPTDFSNLMMAVAGEAELVSHRTTPLFQTDFDELDGCIYHLGNPYLKFPENHDRIFLASELMKEYYEKILFFPKFRNELKIMLEVLLEQSPVGKLIFTSDYQFGPKPRKYKRPLTLDSFWRKHDSVQLPTNSLVQIVRKLQ